MGFIKSMDIDLELAINAIDEIQDIYQWELELTNILTEFTLRVQFSLDNLSSQVFTPETLSPRKVEQTPLQKICIKKLKEYRCVILDQNEVLRIKDLEKAKLQEENNHMKEMNMAYSVKIEELRAYLDEADTTNSALRSENACLKYKLISLEASISNIEHKSQQLSKEMIDEEAKKYQIFMERFQANVDSQNDLINRLQQELEGFNFLKKKYDNLEKEDKHHKREIKKLEETVIELNNDYQNLLVEFTKRPCSQKKASRDDPFKSTTASRNLIESDEESQNKNILRKIEFGHSVINRPSPHIKTSSLMHEVILTKATTTPISQSELNIGFQARLLQARKSRTNKNAKMGDKNFLSQSFKPSTLNRIPDYEGHHNSCGTISMNELPKREGSQAKSREIITSELGSEIDADDRKKMNSHFGLESQLTDKEDIFERENILLSWEENDFPQLHSRTSLYSERSGQKRIGEFSARKLVVSPHQLVTKVFDDEKESQPIQKDREGNTNLGLLCQKLKGLIADENIQNNLPDQAYLASCFDHGGFKTPSKIGEKIFDKSECYQSAKQLLFEFEAPINEDTIEVSETVMLDTAKKVQTFEKTTQTEIESILREKVQFNSAKEQIPYEEKICLSEIDQQGLTTESQISSTSELKKERKRKFNFSEYHLMQSSILSASTAFSEKPLYTLYETASTEETQAPTKKSIFVSVAEKVGPIIASASLTYLLLRKNLK